MLSRRNWRNRQVERGAMTRAEVLEQLAISRHQLYYALDALDHMDMRRDWGLYPRPVVRELREWFATRAARPLPDPVRYLVNRGRSEGAARRWLQRHPSESPSAAPPPRKRRRQ